MDEKFWDDVAEHYDDEIFNVHQHDLTGRLAYWIGRLINKSRTVADFGCGVGRGIPPLARRAKQVVATDHSQQSLKIARGKCGEFSNVVYAKRDLAAARMRLCQADVGLAVNVVIMPNAETRTAIVRNLKRNIAPGGHLLLVVPSLETVLYTYTRLLQWRQRDNEQYGDAARAIDRSARREITSLAAGNVMINGTETKHFLREEGQVLLADCGFETVAVEKIEYPWDADIDDPPAWLDKPYPWDWLFVARRV